MRTIFRGAMIALAVAGLAGCIYAPPPPPAYGWGPGWGPGFAYAPPAFFYGPPVAFNFGFGFHRHWR